MVFGPLVAEEESASLEVSRAEVGGSILFFWVRCSTEEIKSLSRGSWVEEVWAGFALGIDPYRWWVDLGFLDFLSFAATRKGLGSSSCGSGSRIWRREAL